MKHLSELCTVALLNLFVEILDDFRSDPLLYLIELLPDGLYLKLGLMQLRLSLLELCLECLLSNLEAADFDVEVLLLLVQLHDPRLLVRGVVSQRLHQLRDLILQLSRQNKRRLSLLGLILVALALNEVYQLLL